MVDLNEKKFDVKLCQTQRRNLAIKQLEQPKEFFFLIQKEYYRATRGKIFFLSPSSSYLLQKKIWRNPLHPALYHLWNTMNWKSECWVWRCMLMVRKEVWEEKFKVRKSGRYDSYFYYWTKAQYKVWNVDDFNVRWCLRSLLLCKWNSGIMSIKSRMLFNILSLFWSIVATIMSKYVLSSLIGISNVHELKQYLRPKPDLIFHEKSVLFEDFRI